MVTSFTPTRKRLDSMVILGSVSNVAFRSAETALLAYLSLSERRLWRLRTKPRLPDFSLLADETVLTQ